MNYRIEFHENAKAGFLHHFTFLSKSSLSAAERMKSDYLAVIKRLKDNPFQFPLYIDEVVKGYSYRKALFGKRYQLIFRVFGKTVFVDAVYDCRQLNENGSEHMSEPV